MCLHIDVFFWDNFQAGLVTTLSTQTIVFGATNPKGQYDPNQCILSSQVIFAATSCGNINKCVSTMMHFNNIEAVIVFDM